MMQNNHLLVPLGQYIVQCDERNSDNLFTVADVRGISISKVIIDTKANMEGVPLTSYKLFKPKDFCFVPVTSRNGNKITLAINNTDRSFIVSATYEVFRILDHNDLDPLFLYLWFCRPEFDRYARFNSWGSARESFSFADMQRVEIPKPDIDTQKKIVETWLALRAMKEENEALAAPLNQLCLSKIQELKHSLKRVPIGPCISKGGKNSDGKISKVLGIGQEGFIEPQKIPNESLKNYKILSKDCICYAPPLYNIKSDAIHQYKWEEDAVCSPIYEVFFCDKTKLIPEYLMLWLKREEFKRYAEFYSLGVRNTFNYSLMEEFAIPIPSLNEQKAIVGIYTCAQEAKRIAMEADRLSRNICPALMQKVINT